MPIDHTHVRAGQLRHHVTIEVRDDQAAGPLGDLVEDWKPIKEHVPADLDYLEGHKLAAAKQVHAEATVRVEVRYMKAATANCRILTSDGDRLYPVGSIPDHKNRRLVLLCKERP